MPEPFELFKRPVDKKRMQSLFERTEQPLESSNIWYIHSVLTQCFLPYQDPKADTWERRNGDFSIALVAGHLRNPLSETLVRRMGLPYGPKPRLFQSYICMKAIKNKSATIPVERSMSDMMHMLGLAVTGGRPVLPPAILRLSDPALKAALVTSRPRLSGGSTSFFPRTRSRTRYGQTRFN
jgi:hypothetical protein